IRVFHQKNGGVSRARNLALSHARGRYLCFLDSDDTLDASFLEKLLAMRDQAGEIPVCCGFEVRQEGAATQPAKALPEKKIPLDRFLFELLIGRLGLPLCCVTWLMPAQTALLARFDEELGYGEDSLFVAQMLLHYREVWYDPQPLYYYLTDRAGNTVTERSLKKSESRYRSLEKTLDLCRGRLPQTEQALIKQLVECASEGARAAKGEGRRGEYKAYKKRCLAWWKKLRRCPAISPRDRLRLLAYGLAPVLSERIMLKIYGRV
ncbi:MAG: glycosyltransferase, partial [Lachnospiraceae bacterium]|nr:glycosyltransferase [Lachnospiraceae bacterium]